jgi:DNA polymerase III alpha subunit (gram-positive type)
MISQTHSNLNSSVNLSLRQILASVDASSCPNLLNFHLHTVYSDGKLEPEDLIGQAIALNMSHLAITDHHTVSGYYQAVRHLANFANRGKCQPSIHRGAYLRLWV